MSGAVTPGPRGSQGSGRGVSLLAPHRGWLASTVWTIGILLALVGVWQMIVSTGFVSSLILPSPASVWDSLRDLTVAGELASTTLATVATVIASFGIGCVAGIAVGILCWLMPLVGRTIEPYLAAFYAVPLVVFYPMLVVVVGLNRWSIIILASGMAVVPMCLNTWLGFERIPRSYLKLADALECRRDQRLFRVLLPAATEQILAGARIALIYAIIGTISMEFLVAPDGLGFHVRYEYQALDQPATMAYTVVIFSMALALVVLMRILEAGIKRATT